MPELPEVEWVARTLRPKLVGRRITSVETSGKKLRQPVERLKLQKLAVGATVDAVNRIGKYLLIDLSSGATLLSHLGMTGWFVFRDPKEPRASHTHVVFTLDSGLELRYADHRRFGILRVYSTAKIRNSAELAILGVDPLEPEFTVEYLRQQLKSTKRDVKTFLLDQTRIAGVGNIYACEALYLAGISPRRKTPRVDAEKLHAAVQKVLRAGIENRGTSFSDYVNADGESGDNQSSLHVYGREGERCRVCSSVIRRLVQGARSTFYCPKCQSLKGQK
jgi:formamidopyrimidine-DNA glycosylase